MAESSCVLSRLTPPNRPTPATTGQGDRKAARFPSEPFLASATGFSVGGSRIPFPRPAEKIVDAMGQTMEAHNASPGDAVA
jgi:hypothetical protein